MCLGGDKNASPSCSISVQAFTPAAFEVYSFFRHYLHCSPVSLLTLFTRENSEKKKALADSSDYANGQKVNVARLQAKTVFLQAGKEPLVKAISEAKKGVQNLQKERRSKLIEWQSKQNKTAGELKLRLNQLQKQYR